MAHEQVRYRWFTVGYWGFIFVSMVVGLILDNPFIALGGFPLTVCWTWFWLSRWERERRAASQSGSPSRPPTDPTSSSSATPT